MSGYLRTGVITSLRKSVAGKQALGFTKGPASKNDNKWNQRTRAT